MPGAGRAEVYFIVGMMILIVILSVAAVFIFFKTYRKEMREKDKVAETRPLGSVPNSKSEIQE